MAKMKALLVIDGAATPATGDRCFECKDPIEGRVVTTAAAASAQDGVRAVESCAAALPGWAATAPAARRDILLNAASLVEARGDQLKDMMVAETGATHAWAGFNAHLASGMLKEAASLTTQIKGEIIPANKPGMFSMAIRRPAGVVLSIAPWNAPIILAVRSFCTALACGNTVVMKSSEASPGTQFLLTQIMSEAGLPPGVLNLISNAPGEAGPLVEAMIAHPAVRRVNFTGSTRTGKIVAEVAARYLKPALLELGGQAPLIVLKDADIDNAVRAAAFGAFMHQGQICMSTERVVVDRSIADEFAGKLASKASTLVAGPPAASNAPLGAMISGASAQRVRGLINDAVKKGAKLLTGGLVEGPFMNAAVLDHVTPDMEIYQDESFGPVVTVVRVDSVEDAIRVANDTKYGLSSAIFSRDVKLAIEVANRLDFGCCHINGPTVYDEAQMPLGGMKASGYGRFGGLPGVHEFTEVQWLTIEDPNQHYPI